MELLQYLPRPPQCTSSKGLMVSIRWYWGLFKGSWGVLVIRAISGLYTYAILHMHIQYIPICTLTNLHVYTYTHTQIYIRTYIDTRIYVKTHIYKRLHACINIHIHICPHCMVVMILHSSTEIAMPTLGAVRVVVQGLCKPLSPLSLSLHGKTHRPNMDYYSTNHSSGSPWNLRYIIWVGLWGPSD